MELLLFGVMKVGTRRIKIEMIKIILYRKKDEGMVLVRKLIFYFMLFNIIIV